MHYLKIDGKLVSIILAISLLSGCGKSSSSSLDKNQSNTQRESQSASMDTTAPTISLMGERRVSITVDENFTDPGFSAMDDKDGDLSSLVKVESDLNTHKEGNYTISYSVSDSSSNKTTTKRYISVVRVDDPKSVIPIDSNIELKKEKNVLYYADPRPQEHGLNRVLRIDYAHMTYEAIPVNGINPHSIDRAGESDRFYIRTQNSDSFDVVNFKTGEVKSVNLGDHKPRAIGAYNKKYNIQLLSAKDMPVVDIIDVSTDRVVATLGDRNHYNKSQITSNAGAGSATGHALWFDEDHFGLIDRVNRVVRVYEVSKLDNDMLNIKETSTLSAGTAFHAIERDRFPISKKDTRIFYAMGEGDLSQGFNPYVLELEFDPKLGVLKRTGRTAWLSQSSERVDNVSPTTHHAGVTPDGKYLIVPVSDGKVYIIDRKSMNIIKVLPAKLGAAHIEFSKSRNLAIVTNHFSNILTFIDLDDLSIKKELRIGFHHQFDPNDKHLFQPHFSYVSPDGQYYYTFATQDGDFLKIDLDSLEIVDKIHVGGAPEQAHS